MGEVPEVTKLLFEPEFIVVGGGEAVVDAGLGKLGTFLWGSLITVSRAYFPIRFVSVTHLVFRVCSDS